ncbi:MAG TPA: CocE/NonD family hydrolase [Ktedonobacteraceae bacterium]
MSILSRVIGGVAKLPPVETRNVLVERDLKVPMPDGIVLLANRYAPRGVEKPPLLLVRCCYGRGGFFGLLYGYLFAERGFQVLIQSIRGTFGSGGIFRPFVDEHDDGLATVAWLKTQPWYPGSFATNGPSYLGLVQWAIASEVGPDLKALAIQVSTAEFRSQTYPGEAFSLDTALSWTHLVATQEKTNMLAQVFSPTTRKFRPIFAHLPLRDVDQLAIGAHAPHFQEWLENNEPGSAYWQARGFEQSVKDITAPLTLLGGWYDIFLPWQLRDYRTLREAGKQPYLTIGPWSHAQPATLFNGFHESLAWFNTHLRGQDGQLRAAPVRLFITGANEWRFYPDWPPPGTQSQRLHLLPGGALATDLPPASEPEHYRYDPARPTPALSGPVLTGNALPTDNRSLEARADVLIYTSAPLTEDLEVIGPVQADLYVSSSLAYTDFFARLCDVNLQGKSMNVCDGLLRVQPDRPAAATDGTLHLTFDLWPTAHRFRAGHCLRLQISSGAHPRFARNTGSGEPLATSTKLICADQSIYHDPEHPSAIIISIPEL